MNTHLVIYFITFLIFIFIAFFFCFLFFLFFFVFLFIFFYFFFFFFSSRRRHTRSKRDWSSDVCSSDLLNNFFSIDHEVYFPTLLRSKIVNLFSEPPKTQEDCIFKQPSTIFKRSEERRVGKECRSRRSTYH